MDFCKDLVVLERGHGAQWVSVRIVSIPRYCSSTSEYCGEHHQALWQIFNEYIIKYGHALYEQ